MKKAAGAPTAEDIESLTNAVNTLADNVGELIKCIDQDVRELVTDLCGAIHYSPTKEMSLAEAIVVGTDTLSAAATAVVESANESKSSR